MAFLQKHLLILFLAHLSVISTFGHGTLKQLFLQTFNIQSQRPQSQETPETSLLQRFVDIPRFSNLHKVPVCNRSYYTDLGDISNGRDGKVHLYRKESPSTLVIWKEKHPEAPEGVNIQLEMSILTQLNHTHISPHIICRCQHNAGFMMERIPGVALSTFIQGPPKSLSFETFLNISMQMVRIVQTLHQQGVVHLDLHLGNWMYDKRSQRVWVIDFSCSRFLSSGRLNHRDESPETDVSVLGSSLSILFSFVVATSEEPLSVAEIFNDMKHSIPLERPTLEQVATRLSRFAESG